MGQGRSAGHRPAGGIQGAPSPAAAWEWESDWRPAVGIPGGAMRLMPVSPMRPAVGLTARAAHRRFLDPQGRRHVLPLIFEAAVGKARDTVILKLTRRMSRKVRCCGTAMGSTRTATFGTAPTWLFRSSARSRSTSFRPRQSPASTVAGRSAPPIKVLLITGDNVAAHNWQQTLQGARRTSGKGWSDLGRRHGRPVEGSDRRQPGQVRRLALELQGYAHRPARVSLV